MHASQSTESNIRLGNGKVTTQAPQRRIFASIELLEQWNARAHDKKDTRSRTMSSQNCGLANGFGNVSIVNDMIKHTPGQAEKRHSFSSGTHNKNSTWEPTHRGYQNELGNPRTLQRWAQSQTQGNALFSANAQIQSYFLTVLSSWGRLVTCRGCQRPSS